MRSEEAVGGREFCAPLTRRSSPPSGGEVARAQPGTVRGPCAISAPQTPQNPFSETPPFRITLAARGKRYCYPKTSFFG